MNNTNNKNDHFQHLGSLRLNRVAIMEEALGDHHNASDLKKLKYTAKLELPMQEVVLSALAASGTATNLFLAKLQAHKRDEALGKLQRHREGVAKRRGKRGPNSRTLMKAVSDTIMEDGAVERGDPWTNRMLSKASSSINKEFNVYNVEDGTIVSKGGN